MELDVIILMQVIMQQLELDVIIIFPVAELDLLLQQEYIILLVLNLQLLWLDVIM